MGQIDEVKDEDPGPRLKILQPSHIPQVLSSCVLTLSDTLPDTPRQVVPEVSVEVFTLCLHQLTVTRSYLDTPSISLLWADSSVGRATGF